MAARKPIEWVASSLEDLAEMPAEVKSDVGYAVTARRKENRSLSEENDVKIVRGSGNVFADLGLPFADEEALKADLAISIRETIEKKGLTQAQAVKLMGESQPNISLIVGGKLRPFSAERLMEHLTALGKDVELRIKDAPKSRDRGHLKVVGK